MAFASPTDWNIGEGSGLVSIGTHSLYLHVTGPDCVPGQPVIILFAGVTSTISAWPAVQRLTSHFARLVAYDRSGLGHSQKSPNSPTSTTIAKELDALLQAADIQPPYITLGHSWGGILSLEFLALRPNDVVGMIFVDATQARFRDVIPFMDPAILAVNSGLNWYEAIQLKENSVLTAEEYQVFLATEQNPNTRVQAGQEFVGLMDSYAVSGKRGFFNRNPPLLEDGPVCVIKGHNDRDLRRAYTAGVERGNGTEEERARYREILETWESNETELQKELLTLSTNTYWLEAEKGGHNTNMQDPEVIVEGIQWTLANTRL